jgi:hypothetical protein
MNGVEQTTETEDVEKVWPDCKMIKKIKNIGPSFIINALVHSSAITCFRGGDSPRANGP